MMTRRIGRVNRATREQCTRLIQMAGVTFGMCMQLKSCSGDVFFNDSPVTGGIVDTGDEWQLVSWTLPTSCMCYFLIFALQVFFLRGAVHGFAAMVIGGGFLLSGPLAWESLQLAPKRCDTSYCGDAGFQIQMDGETQFVDDMVVSSEGDHLPPRKVPRFWASWSFHG